jgi:hypothetical protein
MHMPKPNENHHKLHVLSGKWIGIEKIHPMPWDPAGGDATAESNAIVAFGGFCVIMDYVQTRGGNVSYRGHGVFGWDDKVRKYTMYWFDSMAGAPLCPAAEGTWVGNLLVYVSKNEMGWGRYSYQFESESKFKFTIETSQDGQAWTVFLEGEFTRT